MVLYWKLCFIKLYQDDEFEYFNESYIKFFYLNKKCFKNIENSFILKYLKTRFKSSIMYLYLIYTN